LNLQLFLRGDGIGDDFTQSNFPITSNKQHDVATPRSVLQEVYFFGHEKKCWPVGLFAS
jgi:hypothetical protein